MDKSVERERVYKEIEGTIIMDCLCSLEQNKKHWGWGEWEKKEEGKSVIPFDDIGETKDQRDRKTKR